MQELQFKFKFINAQGHEEGFFSKKGTFDGEMLRLDQAAFPVGAILHLDNRDNRVVMSIAQTSGIPVTIMFSVTSGSVTALKAAIGKARSALWAKIRREELRAKGREHEFHAVECPHCEATVDLTGFRQSPQVSCEFCHTISDPDTPQKDETHYRLCDECGMFSKPRRFTIFYFYFLLVVYGWSSRTTWRCPACMRGDAWKMLFGNLIFILGVPVALIQLIRAYGGADLKSMYRGLDSANIKARKGNLEGAIGEYRRILEQNPHAAGIKYNIGLAFTQQNQLDSAAITLESALNDCCNYRPAARLLVDCYSKLGQENKVADLNAEWGMDPAEVGEEETADPRSDSSSVPE
jgi:hypothetical protein